MHDEPRSSMFFRQYYLECLSHASYLIGDTRTGRAVVVDPQRDVDALPRRRRRARADDRAGPGDPLPCRLPVRPPRARRADRGDHRLRTGRGGPGRVPDRHVRRRRPDRARRRRARRDAGDPRDPGPHPGVDQHRRPRRARRPVRRAHRRHAVHRRRRTPGPAGVGRGHRRRARPPALPLAARPAAHPPRRDEGVPRPRRRLGLREATVDRDGVDDRRAAGDELRARPDERGRVRRRRHPGPVRGAPVLRVRRQPQPPAARPARRPTPPCRR